MSLALALFVWADLAAAEGRADRSARLFGAARQALAGIPHIMPPSIGRGHKKTIDELRRSMGEDVFETLRRLGTEMSLEEAVEFVLTG